jgi:hypothetical protein
MSSIMGQKAVATVPVERVNAPRRGIPKLAIDIQERAGIVHENHPKNIVPFRGPIGM